MLPEAVTELEALPERERDAMNRALVKLRVLGDGLGYPHTSPVQGTTLRELRPRQGRSPWRAFFRREPDGTIVVAAIGSEAVHNRRKFNRAVADAEQRLADREPE